MKSINATSLTENTFNVKLDFELTSHFDLSSYQSWAKILLEKNSWRYEDIISSEFEQLEPDAQEFIFSLFQLNLMFFQLVKIPVFSTSSIISFLRKDTSGELIGIKFKLPLISFIPEKAYKIAIKTALKLCLWMTNNPPTEDNINKLFVIIIKNIINPLTRIVPSGKSTIPILRVAHSIGVPYIHLGLGVYQLGWGSKSKRLDRSVTDLDSAIGSKLANDKFSTARVLRLAGLPSPIHDLVFNEQEAVIAAEKIGFPLVVKPADRERGEGVSVDVLDINSLREAFAAALKVSISKQVLIERQVSGVCHRLFIAGNKLLYAVKRMPFSVKADGVLTVSQLVNKEFDFQQRRPPWIRSEIRKLDDLALKAISSAGFSPTSIPSCGVYVPLRRIESTAWGGVDEDVTQIIHEENLSTAIRATKLLGLNVAGVDIISLDISEPWHKNGAIINEVNFAPLLGGGEISRSYIPRFFSEFIESDGKIPLEIFDDKIDALERHNELLKLGLRCIYTTSNETIDSYGNFLVMPFFDTASRVKALLLRSDVDAIIVNAISMQDTEL